MHISFIGMGGTGKSTLAKWLESELNGRGLCCQYVYLPERKGLQKTISYFRTNNESNKKQVSPDVESQQFKSKTFKTVIWSYLSWLENFYIKQTLHSRKESFLITDRYFFDEIIDFKIRGVGNFLFELFPEPDMTILLDAPAEIVYERKHEHPLEFLEMQRKGYLEMAEKRKFLVIDTSQKIEKTKEDILKAVLKFADYKWMEKNRTLFMFLSRTESNKDLYSKGEQFVKMKMKTISFLNRTKLPGFLLIKTIKPYSDIGFDIDVSIRNKDAPQFIEELKKIGRVEETGKNKADCYLENMLPIDIHYGPVSFDSNIFLSEETLWKDVRHLEEGDIPSIESELLILASHAFFELGSLSYLDYLNISYYINKADLDLCRKYSKETGWGKSFDKFVKLVRKIESNKAATAFPLILSPIDLTSAYLEKKYINSENLVLVFKKFYVLYLLRKIPYFVSWVNRSSGK